LDGLRVDRRTMVEKRSAWFFVTMNWVLEHLQLLIGAAAAIAYYLNRRRTSADGAARPAQARGPDSEEQAERTRRVQEVIRRKIAERRGRAPDVVERRTARERMPPLVRPTQVPPLDPFGGPMRRIIRKIEDAAAKLDQPIDNPEAGAKTSELVRQAKLAEQLRELEVARVAQERRAAEIALVKIKRRAETRPMPAVFGDVRAVLRDPRELRRAVILREVLGPPVGLR
jgi:hypothetical protein